MLTRDAILVAKDLRSEVIAVPEWGGEVLVRGMTGSERDRFETAFIGANGKIAPERMQNIRAMVAGMCMVDEAGKRLFSDGDINELGKKSANALQRVFDAAQRMSGLTPEAMQSLEKNLAGDQGENSVSS